MQVRTLYVSRAVGPQTTTVTASILATAQAHNRAHGIRGVLCQGQGLYIQVLEGERRVVNQLYSRILADRRHRDIEMLYLEEITGPRYPHWSMAHVMLHDDHPLLRSRAASFDPFQASGATVSALLDELVAAGHELTLPAH